MTLRRDSEIKKLQERYEPEDPLREQYFLLYTSADKIIEKLKQESSLLKRNLEFIREGLTDDSSNKLLNEKRQEEIEDLRAAEP